MRRSPECSWRLVGVKRGSVSSQPARRGGRPVRPLRVRHQRRVERCRCFRSARAERLVRLSARRPIARPATGRSCFPSRSPRIAGRPPRSPRSRPRPAAPARLTRRGRAAPTTRSPPTVEFRRRADRDQRESDDHPHLFHGGEARGHAHGRRPGRLLDRGRLHGPDRVLRRVGKGDQLADDHRRLTGSAGSAGSAGDLCAPGFAEELLARGAPGQRQMRQADHREQDQALAPPFGQAQARLHAERRRHRHGHAQHHRTQGLRAMHKADPQEWQTECLRAAGAGARRAHPRGQDGHKQLHL